MAFAKHTSITKVSHLPLQAFNELAGGLEEVAQAFGHRVLPPLRWSFTLFCVDRTETEEEEEDVCKIHSDVINEPDCL